LVCPHSVRDLRRALSDRPAAHTWRRVLRLVPGLAQGAGIVSAPDTVRPPALVRQPARVPELAPLASAALRACKAEGSGERTVALPILDDFAEAHTQYERLPRDYMGTATGGRVFILDPTRSDIRLFDLAMAQARVCRFGGHLDWELAGTYSVAQHAVLVSYLLERDARARGGERTARGRLEARCGARELALAGLFHDAAESVLGDVPSPLKWLLGEAYAALERRWELEIFTRYGLANALAWRDGVRGLPAAVKAADKRAFELECWDLLTPRARARALPGMTERPEGPTILPLNPERAAVAWLRRYWELTT
jgi:hypothetical protein